MKPIRHAFILLIELYQKMLSPLVGRECRYYPTCSHFAIMLFRFDNIFLAFFKTFFRILSCNALFSGGFSPPFIYKNMPDFKDSRYTVLTIFKQRHFLSKPEQQGVLQELARQKDAGQRHLKNIKKSQKELQKPPKNATAKIYLFIETNKFLLKTQKFYIISVYLN